MILTLAALYYVVKNAARYGGEEYVESLQIFSPTQKCFNNLGQFIFASTQ